MPKLRNRGNSAAATGATVGYEAQLWQMADAFECPACHQPGYLPSKEDERAAIEAFLRREVLPYAPDAWYDLASVKIGYEISFNRYFYKPKALRSLDEIRADLLAVEKEAEGLLAEILGRSDG